MAEASPDPIFQIQRVYLKDLSLEQPNSPEILLNQEQPGVDIQLGVEAKPVADVIQRGGFPPVHLAEINFQAMYEQQQAEAAAAAVATPAAPQIIV